MARAPWRIPLAAAASLVLSANVMTLADANAYAAAQPARPSAANTGVPPGTTLTRHDGNITITQTGTVLKDLDVHGFVIVEASNVTIEQSILRGGVSHGDTALVKVVSGTNVWSKTANWSPNSRPCRSTAFVALTTGCCATIFTAPLTGRRSPAIT